jgi:transcriptional regulator with XRE-family HTH domain
MSQRELQRLSGLDQGAISRLENGKLNGLRWQRFARIVDALDGLEYAAPPRQREPWPGRSPERTTAETTTLERTPLDTADDVADGHR